MRPGADREGAAGMKPPPRAASARNTAENCTLASRCLAQCREGANIKPVVAGLPQRSGTDRPNRYPSPDGRRCVIIRTPPLFPLKTTGWHHRQELAQSRSSHAWDFDARLVLASCRAACTRHAKRGGASCDTYSGNNPRLYMPFSSFRPSRPVGTRSENRRSSVAAPAWAPRRCWTAILPLAQSQGRRATSPTASPIQAAATDTWRAFPRAVNHHRNRPRRLARAVPFVFGPRVAAADI